MADYLEKLKKYMNSDPSKDGYLDKAVKGALGMLEDKAPAPGDDAIQDTMSPIDFLPVAEGAALAAKGAKMGAKALAQPAERILANQTGAIGADLQAADMSQLLQKIRGMTKLPNAAPAAAPTQQPMSQLAKMAKVMADNPSMDMKLINSVSRTPDGKLFSQLPFTPEMNAAKEAAQEAKGYAGEFSDQAERVLQDLLKKNPAAKKPVR